MASTRTLLWRRTFALGVQRIALVLGRWGITPNGLTYASLVPAIASGIAAALGAFVVAVICLLVSGICDLLDGSLARATGNTTAYGALLDSTLDRLCDAAPLLGLTVFFAPIGLAVIPGLTLVGAYTISYVRARAESLGGKLPWLWMRRSDRLIILGLALLLGTIHIPGIYIRAPLTLLCIGIAGLLNIMASVSALLAARGQFRSEGRRGS